MTHISPGNGKTGNCFSFDLPAKETCPGMTVTCEKRCYAAALMRIYPAVAKRYDQNLEFAKSKNFVIRMIRDIPRNCEFRIHVSGDFFSLPYIHRWYEIASRRNDVVFYCYTRSWQFPILWRAIQRLASLPNVTVNLSCDENTGKPPEDFRWTYLTNDDTAPNWLRTGDIVFRSNHNGRKGNHQWKRKDAIEKGLDPNTVAPLLHKIGEAVVCPFERGRSMPDNFSCSLCRLCIKKAPNAKSIAPTLV